MQIIDGKKVSEFLREDLKSKITDFYAESGRRPRLVVIIVGNDPASEIYVSNKAKAAAEVGIVSETVRLNETIGQAELENVILGYAKDDITDGLLVQLPLPKHLNAERALALIPDDKDVDGFSVGNTGRLCRFTGDGVYPCTPSGIIQLLKYYDIPLSGKRAVVVGRSNILGKPVALMLLNEDCTVTVCHSKTKNLKEITLTADILVSAVGKKNVITADMIKDGAVVIDAGITRENGKIYGDVDFTEAAKKVSYITPVPGGVGPMTITMLMINTYQVAVNHNEKR